MEISLLDLQPGEKAEIKRLKGGLAFKAKLASLNIRIGKIIKMITIQPFRGPVVAEIDSRRITVGRKMAMRIFTTKEI